MCWIHNAVLVIVIDFYALTYTNAKFTLKPIEINLGLKSYSLFHTESKSHSKETKTIETSTSKSTEDDTLSTEDEFSKYFKVFNKIPRQETNMTYYNTTDTNMTDYNTTDTADPKEVFVVTNDSQIDFIDHNSDIFHGMIVSSDPGITDIEESPPELDHFQLASRHRHRHRYKRCVPGIFYKLDCNICNCPKGRLLCTQWKCPEKYAIDDQEEPQCMNGENYKKDCNTCFCDHGVFVCTKTQCGELKPVIDWKRKECIPGRFYQNKCNRCSCTSDFKLKCTNYKCNKYNQVKDCDVGATTKLDCNTCTCNEDGRFVCTRMICSHVLYPQMVCYPGEVFKRGCKVCKCNNFGTGGACTNKLCYSSHVIWYTADSKHTHTSTHYGNHLPILR